MVVTDNVFKTNNVTEIVTSGRMRREDRGCAPCSNTAGASGPKRSFGKKEFLYCLLSLPSQVKSQPPDRSQHAYFRYSSSADMPSSESLKIMFNQINGSGNEVE